VTIRCTVVQATTTAVLQISLCKSQPTAGRLPLPLSNLYLHTARVGLWTDRLEAATVDLRFFVCRFVSRCVMYGTMDCRGPAECAHGAFNLLSGICTIYSYHEPVTTNVMSYDRVTLTLSAIVELCQFLRTKGLFQVETVRERSFSLYGHREPRYGRSERPHGLSWTGIDRTR